jgi:hypothetical protein
MAAIVIAHVLIAVIAAVIAFVWTRKIVAPTEPTPERIAPRPPRRRRGRILPEHGPAHATS